MKKVELLSPVGGLNHLKAAVASGADSVYFGSTMFNARMGAENFEGISIEHAIKYAKLRNVKVYITFNTLLYNNEIKPAIDMIKNIYSMGADAVIVQDLGLLKAIRDNINIAIHASTQMSCNNLASVKLLEKLNISRVVLAREMTIKNIKFIAENTKVELETFAHGALCASFSGQCLYSFFKGGRSGNRGSCAQPCRLSYGGGKTNYPISTKDLMTIDILPDLLKSGISALKIEGRIKRSEYVAVVTSIYRKAIDAILENKSDFEKEDSKNINIDLRAKYKEALIKIFNRGGFTKGYFFNNDNSISNDIFNNTKPSHQGEYIGTILDYKKNKLYVKTEKQLNVYDGLSFGSSGTLGMEISDMYKNGEKIKNGIGKLYFSCVLKGIKIGDSIYRTTDKSQMDYAHSIIESDNIKHKLKLFLKVDNKITVKAENDYLKAEFVSNYIVEEAKTHSSSKDDILKSITKTGGTVFIFEPIETKIIGTAFIPVKIINDARRSLIEILEKKLLASESINYNLDFPISKKSVIEYPNTKVKVAITNDIKSFESREDIKNNYNIKIYSPKIYDIEIIKYFENKTIDGIILPHITFDDDIEKIKTIIKKDMIVICNNIGQIMALKDLCKVWAGIGLNALNDKAVDFLYSLKCSMVISSMEAREKLKHTISIKSGLIPVMNFVVCPKSSAIGCDRCVQKNIYDTQNKTIHFDCKTVQNKTSFILENIKRENGEIDVFYNIN